MSDIDEMVAWLRSVLDEDELVARDAGGRNWGREAYGCVVDAADNGLVVYSEGTPSREQADHIARHDPAHELNVVAAHRAILDAYEYKNAETLPFGSSGTYALEHVVRLLAAGYRHRDGYRQEWSV